MPTTSLKIMVVISSIAMACLFVLPPIGDVGAVSTSDIHTSIFISSASKLNKHKKIIETIYEALKTKDGQYSTITNGQYVRVAFEKKLINDNDITIYAKSAKSAKIEVYQSGGSKRMAVFEHIKKEGFYKVSLTGLESPTKAFDLKVMGSVQIDYITDPSSGPNSPSTGADDTSIGSAMWNTPGNITASDDSYANASLSSLNTTSHYLKATGFGFSIPTGATINGIVVEWERSDNNLGGANSKDNAIRIVKGGTIGSTDKSSASTWPASDAYASYGSSSDLWGETWTVSDINASTFGTALSAINVISGSAASPRVDHARITVYYTTGISISGTIYTNEGITTMGSGRTVSVSVNGAAAAGSTTTASNGTYTLSGITVNAGDVLTLYLDNNTENGVTVTVGNGSNLTAIDIYQNDLIARQDNSGSLANTNLNTADNNGDTDISAIYSVSGGTLTIASGKSLFIPTGNTYAPGGNVSVGGNFTNNGTYTKGTETLTLTGTGSSQTLKTNGSSLYNLTINGSGSTYTLQDALTTSNNLTITSGTFDDSTSNYAISIGGNWSNSGVSSWSQTQPAGAADKNWYPMASSSDGSKLVSAIFGGRLYLSSNSGSTWTETQPAETTDKSWYTTASSFNGTKLIAGVSRGRLYLSSNSGSTWTETQPAGNVDTNWTATASSSDGTKLIAGVSIGRLYLSSNSGSTWTETQPAGNTNAAWQALASSSDGSTLIAGVNSGRLYISFDFGASWSQTQPAGATDKNWYVAASSSDGTKLIAGELGGRLYLSSNSGSTWTETQPAGNANASWNALASSFDGNYLIAGSDVGRLYLSSNSGSTWTETQPAGNVDKRWKGAASDSSGTRFIAGDFGGRLYIYANTTSIFNARNGTVTLTGTGSQTITSGGSSFYNLTQNGSGGTYALQDPLTTTNNLTITTGTLDANSNGNYAISVGGNWFSSGTFSYRQATLMLTGTGSQTITGEGGGNNFYNVIINALGGTYTEQNTFSIKNNLTIAAGTLDAKSGSNNATLVGGNWSNAGTFTARLSTVTFNSTSSSSIASGTGSIFYNVNINGNPTILFTLQDNFTNTATLNIIQGIFNANGKSVTTNSLSSSNSNTRTITMGSGTWTLTGTGTVWNTATTTNLTLNQNISAITISDVSSTSKTFAGGGKTYYNVSMTGGGTGAIIFTGANTFNNVTINNPKTVTFPASTTTTVNGTFNCTGEAGNIITLNSSVSGTQHTLSKSSGIVNCNFLSLQDSNAAGGADWFAGPDSTNVSNNTGWIFSSHSAGGPPSYPSISGTAYTDEGVTTMGSGRTISVSINGIASAGSTTTVANGAYTVSNLNITAGDVLTIYLQGNTELGVTVTTGTGSNMTGINIFQNELVVRSDNGGSFTGANMDTSDNNGATGISSIYSATDSTTTKLAFGKNLYISANQTYAPGGASSITVAGNWKNAGTFTPATSTVNLTGTGTQTLASGGSGFYTLTQDGVGGTYTLQDNLILGASNVFTLNNGTFNANNKNVTLGFFSSSNSNTRTITMGSGTWTILNLTGVIWNVSSTNLTLNGNTSTIKITNTSNTDIVFNGGGKTYNNIWFSRGTSTGINYINDGPNTFADFKDDGSAAHSIWFSAGTTTTVTTFTVSGSAGNLITINTDTTATHSLVKSGGGTISSDYLNIQHSVATPSNTWYAGTHSTNNQALTTAGSGWIFTAPPSGSPTYDQKHFRFYKDNAGLNSADAYANEDANYNIGLNTAFRLRIEVVNTGSAAGSITRRLEFKEDSGSWTQITTSSNNVRLFDSSNFSDGASTVSRLTASGTFMAGQGKDTGSDTSSLSLASAGYIEDEHSLMLQSTAAGHAYYFRITNASVALNTYSVTPAINAPDSTPPVPSGFNPANGATIKTAFPNITFSLDEPGDCKASTTNASYAAMSGADCTGDGSTAGACLIPNLGVNGSKTIYVACKDVWGNQDTLSTTHSVTYTLSLSSATALPTLTIQGSGKFRGIGVIK